MKKSTNLPGKSALEEIDEDVTKSLHIVPTRLFCNRNIKTSVRFVTLFIWPKSDNFI